MKQFRWLANVVGFVVILVSLAFSLPIVTTASLAPEYTDPIDLHREIVPGTNVYVRWIEMDLRAGNTLN